ncbi:MAG: glycoside hydrolase family 20 zincin-like fold domain-containing protein, partial [Spirochaetaceae bacterium]
MIPRPILIPEPRAAEFDGRERAAPPGLVGALERARIGTDSLPGVRLLQDSALPREGYRLEIGRRDIRLAWGDPAGRWNGVQTLRGLAAGFDAA